MKSQKEDAQANNLKKQYLAYSSPKEYHKIIRTIEQKNVYTTLNVVMR